MRQGTSPGEVLMEEFMLPLGLSVDVVAEHLRVEPSQVSAIIEGTSPMTPEMAHRLGCAFLTLPLFWLSLDYWQDTGAGRTAEVPVDTLPEEAANEIARSVRPLQIRILRSR